MQSSALSFRPYWNLRDVGGGSQSSHLEKCPAVRRILWELQRDGARTETVEGDGQIAFEQNGARGWCRALESAPALRMRWSGRVAPYMPGSSVDWQGEVVAHVGRFTCRSILCGSHGAREKEPQPKGTAVNEL